MKVAEGLVIKAPEGYVCLADILARASAYDSGRVISSLVMSDCVVEPE